MTKAVKIPVTVKMRAGWNDTERNAPTLAKMVEDAGAAAVAVHGRTAAQSYSGTADWRSGRRDRRRADDSGVRQRRLRRAGADCRADARQASKACSSAEACCAIRGSSPRPPILPPAARRAIVTLEDRGRFLLDVYRSAAARARRRGARAHVTIAGSSTRCARSGRMYTKGPRRRLAPADGDQSAESLAALIATIEASLTARASACVSAAARSCAVAQTSPSPFSAIQPLYRSGFTSSFY